MKCLLTLRWLITLPTRMPISAAPRNGSLARRVAATIGSKSFAVAASNSCRLRWRWSANTGLRHTISRSAGKSGLLISARSRWSNMVCATCPALISLPMVGARRVVIQRSPSLPCRSSRIRAPD